MHQTREISRALETYLGRDLEPEDAGPSSSRWRGSSRCGRGGGNGVRIERESGRGRHGAGKNRDLAARPTFGGPLDEKRISVMPAFIGSGWGAGGSPWRGVPVWGAVLCRRRSGLCARRVSSTAGAGEFAIQAEQRPSEEKPAHSDSQQVERPGPGPVRARRSHRSHPNRRCTSRISPPFCLRRWRRA